jgi:hypothetical protein
VLREEERRWQLLEKRGDVDFVLKEFAAVLGLDARPAELQQLHDGFAELQRMCDKQREQMMAVSVYQTSFDSEVRGWARVLCGEDPDNGGDGADGGSGGGAVAVSKGGARTALRQVHGKLEAMAAERERLREAEGSMLAKVESGEGGEWRVESARSRRPQPVAPTHTNCPPVVLAQVRALRKDQ